MSRKHRNLRPTPKGGAAECIKHAKSIAKELVRSQVLDREKFAFRFNDFLRSCRAALATLPKEEKVRASLPIGSPQLAQFVESEIWALKRSDSRFEHFMDLKDVSAHDFTVKPDTATHFAEVQERLQTGFSVQAELKDSEGRTVERRDTDVPFTDIAVQHVEKQSGRRNRKPKQSVLYYLKDWPSEDMVTYCREVMNAVDSLVQATYGRYT